MLVTEDWGRQGVFFDELLVAFDFSGPWDELRADSYRTPVVPKTKAARLIIP
jgi:hypothetical protein